jgi:hypothetical protein
MPLENPITDYDIENARHEHAPQVFDLRHEEAINPELWNESNSNLKEIANNAYDEARDLAISGFEGERAIPKTEVVGERYYLESMIAFTSTIDYVRKGAVNRGSVSTVLPYNQPEVNAFQAPQTAYGQQTKSDFDLAA